MPPYTAREMRGSSGLGELRVPEPPNTARASLVSHGTRSSRHAAEDVGLRTFESRYEEPEQARPNAAEAREPQSERRNLRMPRMPERSLDEVLAMQVVSPSGRGQWSVRKALAVRPDAKYLKSLKDSFDLLPTSPPGWFPPLWDPPPPLPPPILAKSLSPPPAAGLPTGLPPSATVHATVQLVSKVEPRVEQHRGRLFPRPDLRPHTVPAPAAAPFPASRSPPAFRSPIPGQTRSKALSALAARHAQTAPTAQPARPPSSSRRTPMLDSDPDHALEVLQGLMQGDGRPLLSTRATLGARDGARGPATGPVNTMGSVNTTGPVNMMGSGLGDGARAIPSHWRHDEPHDGPHDGRPAQQDSAREPDGSGLEALRMRSFGTEEERDAAHAFFARHDAQYALAHAAFVSAAADVACPSKQERLLRRTQELVWNRYCGSACAADCPLIIGLPSHHH